MREAVIVASSRTPLAKSFRGSFNLTRPDDFAAHCIKDVLGKVPQLDPTEVEDVILGCGQPHGPQGHNVAPGAAGPAPGPRGRNGVPGGPPGPPGGPPGTAPRGARWCPAGAWGGRPPG